MAKVGTPANYPNCVIIEFDKNEIKAAEEYTPPAHNPNAVRPDLSRFCRDDATLLDISPTTPPYDAAGLLLVSWNGTWNASSAQFCDSPYMLVTAAHTIFKQGKFPSAAPVFFRAYDNGKYISRHIVLRVMLLKKYTELKDASAPEGTVPQEYQYDVAFLITREMNTGSMFYLKQDEPGFEDEYIKRIISIGYPGQYIESGTSLKRIDGRFFYCCESATLDMFWEKGLFGDSMLMKGNPLRSGNSGGACLAHERGSDRIMVVSVNSGGSYLKGGGNGEILYQHGMYGPVFCRDIREIPELHNCAIEMASAHDHLGENFKSKVTTRGDFSQYLVVEFDNNDIKAAEAYTLPTQNRNTVRPDLSRFCTEGAIILADSPKDVPFDAAGVLVAQMGGKWTATTAQFCDHQHMLAASAHAIFKDGKFPSAAPIFFRAYNNGSYASRHIITKAVLLRKFTELKNPVQEAFQYDLAFLVTKEANTGSQFYFNQNEPGFADELIQKAISIGYPTQYIENQDSLKTIDGTFLYCCKAETEDLAQPWLGETMLMKGIPLRTGNTGGACLVKERNSDRTMILSINSGHIDLRDTGNLKMLYRHGIYGPIFCRDVEEFHGLFNLGIDLAKEIK